MPEAVRKWIYPRGAWIPLYTTALGVFLGMATTTFVQHLNERRSQDVLLTHIYCDLEATLRDQRLVEPADQKMSGFLYRPPGLEFWNSLAASGSLQQLNDPALAFSLANAYQEIRETRYYLTLYNQETLLNRSGGITPELNEIIRQASQIAIDSITKAKDDLEATGRVTGDVCANIR